MKLTTALALVSLGLAGAACSETTAPDETAPVVEAETVTVEDEYAGTLNLRYVSANGEEEAPSGTFNLNIGGAEDEDDGLIIGKGGFGGGNFQDAPALEIDLSEEESEEADLSVPDEDDDIIRLEPK